MSDNSKLGPPEIPEVLYLCDRRQCANCSWPTCKHTADITHAVNFELLEAIPVIAYFEKEASV